MKTPNRRRSGSNSGLPRCFPVAGALLLAASACGLPSVTIDPAPISPASTVEESAEEVDQALSEVSLRLSAQMADADEDFILAWGDFEGDVRSVVNDLARNPSLIDIEGMQQRVEDFASLIDGSVLELPQAEWVEFTAAFQALIDEVSGSATVLE